MDTDIVVTTVYDPTAALEEAAQRWARLLHAPFVARGRTSLKAIMETHGTSLVLVGAQEGPVVYTPGGRYFFHLSMAELRIKNLLIGKHDHMVTAMGLAPGMTVLDCTLGLATDAIVASFVTGPKGKVTGLESSPVLALVAKYGLGSFTAESNEITAALRRIEVKCEDHRVYLQELPDASVDVVFFDPMFRVPIASSSNLKPLRYLANPQPLSKEIIKEAARVARRRIVVKEAQASGALRELGFALTVGGKYSSVQYGVMEVCH